jgi:antitoxin (DNA-binding transcriptional repressor) of toxin-antitoxin stability system
VTLQFQLIGDVIEFMGEPVARLVPLVSENRFYPELRNQLEQGNDYNDGEEQ